jgi:hypothetical protein
LIGVITGGVLIALGAVCRFNTTALLQKRPSKDRNAGYDEVKVRRYLHRSGIVYMVIGVALFVIGASTI